MIGRGRKYFVLRGKRGEGRSDRDGRELFSSKSKRGEGRVIGRGVKK